MNIFFKGTNSGGVMYRTLSNARAGVALSSLSHLLHLAGEESNSYRTERFCPQKCSGKELRQSRQEKEKRPLKVAGAGLSR